MSASERAQVALRRAEQARGRAAELTEQLRRVHDLAAGPPDAAPGRGAGTDAARRSSAALAEARESARRARSRAAAAERSARQRRRALAAGADDPRRSTSEQGRTAAATAAWTGVAQTAGSSAPDAALPRHRVLDLARRVAGLGTAQLWMAYWQVGGSADVLELDALLCGLAPWGTHEQDLLAHVLNEELQEQGLGRIVPYGAFANPSAAPPALFSALDRLLDEGAAG